MINIANENVVNEIKGTGRTFKCKIIDGSTTYTDIISLKYNAPFSSNSLSIGETPSAYIEAEISDCKSSLSGHEVKVVLSIDTVIDDEIVSKDIPLGLFTVEAPSDNKNNGSGVTKITAYDRMYKTSDYVVSIYGKSEKTIKSLFTSICYQCGFEAYTGNINTNKEEPEKNENLMICDAEEILNGLDCRTALGYLASLIGRNCIVTSEGKFKLVGYTTIEKETNIIEIDSLDTLDFPSSTSTVDYIFCSCGDDLSYDYGTGNNGINITNPLLPFVYNYAPKDETNPNNTELAKVEPVDRLKSILSTVKSGTGNYYMATKFKQLNGDPRIEVGDTILVQHKDTETGEVKESYVPVMSLTKEFDGGLTVEIQSFEPATEFYASVSDQIKFLGETTKKNTDRGEALANLNNSISNSLGLYITEIKDDDGATKSYFHNKEDLATSTYIFTMNSGGFAYTDNWNDGNPIWQTGIDSDGNAVLNTLSVLGINADWLKVGKILSKSRDTYFDLDNSLIQTTSDTTQCSLSAGSLTFSSYKDESKSETVTQAQFAKSGIAITTEEADKYIFIEPDNWNEMSSLQQLAYKVRDYVDYIYKSFYGINIFTDNKDGTTGYLHLDGNKIEFTKSSEVGSNELVAVITSEGIGTKGDIEFSFNESQTSLNRFLTPEDFTVTYAEEETASSNSRFTRQGNLISIIYRGAFKSHAAGDLLFTIPSDYAPKSLAVYATAVFATNTSSSNATVPGVISIHTDGTVDISTLDTTSYSTRPYFQVSYYI